MTFDSAGNMTTDTYTGAGNRTYDAENRMISAGTAGSPALYTYSAEGQRVRRKVDGVEIWQAYGMDGELLAEYAMNGAATNPQKEYGYRNGQLLITVEAPFVSNVAAAANGGTASASSYLTSGSYTFLPSRAINGTRYASFVNDVWLDSTFNTFPDWIEVSFNGGKLAFLTVRHLPNAGDKQH